MFLYEPLIRLLLRVLVSYESLADSGMKPSDWINLGLLIVSALALIVSAAALICTAVGIWFTYGQLKQNQKVAELTNTQLELNRETAEETKKIHQATLLKEFYTTMFSDEEIRKVWYMLEYNQFVYDENFHDSELEKPTDRLLTFIDLLCSLHARGVITAREILYFKYEIHQMYTNEALARYLTHVKNSYAVRVPGIVPYDNYFKYCAAEFGAQVAYRTEAPRERRAEPADASYLVLPLDGAKNLHVWVR